MGVKLWHWYQSPIITFEASRRSKTEKSTSILVKCEDFAHSFFWLQWRGALWILSTRIVRSIRNTILRLCVNHSSITIKTDFKISGLIAKSHVFLPITCLSRRAHHYVVDWPVDRTTSYGHNSFFSQTIRMWNSLRAEVVIFWLLRHEKGIKCRNIITDVRKKLRVVTNIDL